MLEDHTEQKVEIVSKQVKPLKVALIAGMAALVVSAIVYYMSTRMLTPNYLKEKAAETLAPDNGEDTLRGTTTRKFLTTASSTYYTLSYYIPDENENAADLFTEKANTWLSETKIAEVMTKAHAEEMGIRPDGCPGYGYQADYEKYRSDRIVSFVEIVSEYTCGAHPSTYAIVYNENNETGKRITVLTDMYSPAIYGYLSSIARSKLPPQLKAEKELDVADIRDMFDDGTSAQPVNFNSFYFDAGDLVIIFGQYAIGPYAIGSTELRVPLSSLAAYKK